MRWRLLGGGRHYGSLSVPLRQNFFCWFLLSDKALTWDVLCRKGREGPGRCYLCKMDAESNFHLGVECSVTRSVWFELETKLQIKNLWIGDSVISCLKTWCLTEDLKHIIPLPVIVLWYIWKAGNHSCFEDFLPLPFQNSSLCLGMLTSYP